MKTFYPLPVLGAPSQPPPFDWQGWYDAVGGRTIAIDEATMWLGRIQTEQYPRFDGPVAQSRREFVSPADASEWVKGRARALGADLVGIAEIEPTDIYRDRSVNYRYAIVVGARMAYEQFVTVPSESAAVECLRIYFSLGETVLHLADELRAAGIACGVEHPIGDSSVLHVPLALKAGFGELGRHGSIIHPELGPLFRIGSILTNLEMVTDEPMDAGIAAFCDKCQACRIFCPADAIPDERYHDGTVDPIGNPRYVVDTGKCFPYFARANYCSACLSVCAYHHKQWATMNDGTVGPYPTVPFGTVPAPTDPSENVHTYPKLRRDESSPWHR